MKKTAKRAAVLYALVAAFLCGVIFLCVEFALYGSEWATDKTNRHIYSNGSVVNAGTIYDTNGKVLATSKDNKRVFADSASVRKAVLHVVGDTSGVISTGTHNLYRNVLSGYNIIQGVFGLKKHNVGFDVTLNIDSEACRIAYEALGDYNGTVIVSNYKTGQMLCSVSKPGYDVNDVPSDLRTNEKYEGVFLDKACSGLYTPGSIMKIITAAAAIENIPDIYTQTFECDGEYETGDGVVICNDVHGTLSFTEAFAQSCNCAFADISIQLGAGKLKAMAESLGFNRQLYAKEVTLAKSRFNPPSDDKTELGWAGIGQSTTYINPMHFVAIMNAIANGGTGYAPDRVKYLGSSIGELVGRMPETLVKMNPTTAAKLKEMLRSAVTDYYGDERFASLELCAKTGTAEIDGHNSNAMFAAFSAREDLPLSVIVVVEDAGGGLAYASPIANKVLQYFLKNYT